MVTKEKRGWIRIVEAFVAILLIIGFLLIIINKGYIKGGDISSKVYESELVILREIQLNDGLRTTILNINTSDLPVEWEDFDSRGLAQIKNTIDTRVSALDYLECEAKVCEVEDVCGFNKTIDKNVYAKEVLITISLETYSPRQLKLFCWEKVG